MNILEKLKTETRPEHVRLEKDLNLMRDDLSLKEYIGILKRFYGFYRALESKVDFEPERRRVPKLEKDLRHFGVDPQSVKLADQLPETSTEAHLMGLMYVLEGSTLGGTVLLKHFKEKFNLSPDAGISYFCGYGEETVLMWKNFQNRLLTFSESKSSEDVQVIMNAKRTFEVLRDWLTQGN